VVRVADALHVKDDDVRVLLKAAVKSALASGAGRPAPLGRLGLVEVRDGALQWWPWRHDREAPPEAVERILAAWRTPADDLGERVGEAIAAMESVGGALSPADQARVLDELDYDLDESEWRRFGDRIAHALPI
jgi:hypothetical protein